MKKYRKVEEWKLEGKHFLVTVKHHTVDLLPECGIFSGEFSGEGPHRWCIYAYIYPEHPYFVKFDGSEDMCQDAALALPLHCGPSFMRAHQRFCSVAICSYQVGCDYNHLYDEHYTNMATQEEARSVFEDAEVLFDWLENYKGVERQKG